MKIALFGNPNTGKSSIFNLLTGLRQQVGNFPGVTIEKKIGAFNSVKNKHQLTDFPGTYSIYPHSKDEEIVYNALTNSEHEDFPELAIVIVDTSNLERNLLLFSQLYDLKIPLILVLNMWDVAERRGIKIDLTKLQSYFPTTPIIKMNARIGLGKDRLIAAIDELDDKAKKDAFIPSSFPCLIDDKEAQKEEVLLRYEKIREILQDVQHEKTTINNTLSRKLDRILIHRFWGYFIFVGILLVIFQFIFSFAAIPMAWIDDSFVLLSSWMGQQLPSGILNDLFAQGIIPGIAGVLMFIPQIALLFFFIALLEESGYLSRVVFIMDRLMRPFGLNGKSVVPLMSSIACAIPGILATRTISDWKERMITIIIAPLMSCSARIPVYTLLIALVIPKTYLFGFVSLQGLVLLALYFLGIVSALLLAIVLKKFIRVKNKGFLIMEMPEYKKPRWGNICITVIEKVKVFIWDAGKVILAISIILWVLATYGPTGNMEEKIAQAKKTEFYQHTNEVQKQSIISSAKLEGSYIGIMGKFIEPLITPLGYDWKIGISLIGSFAAREVFVGSLSTIYAVHDENEEHQNLLTHLKMARKADGTPVYSLATGVSLMVFYVFAMQCMATLAVVKKETKSWRWPLIQLVIMGALAYIGALISYQLLA
jgi:ferrous iron transport protein B